MVLGAAPVRVVEALHLLEEYGAVCEAMFLVMAADSKVLNVEREVLRGALDVISGGELRTAHMEAMLDAAGRRLAREGEAARCAHVVEQLKEDRVRAELTLVLAAAVAAADGTIAPEEQRVIAALAEGLDVDESRVEELLGQLEAAPPSRAP